MTPTQPAEGLPELLPCPFCGGEASISWKGNVHSTRTIVVKCGGCRYQRTDAALRYGDDWLRDTAIAAWNRRTYAREAIAAAVPVEKLREELRIIQGDGLGGIRAEALTIANITNDLAQKCADRIIDRVDALTKALESLIQQEPTNG